ncbi:hypothetical protein Syun_028564 [Stephania yunnanensis]|uniref:Uncharacterized protein n=1 Tax=Stephania yunnanensis TaxID=152371 RepID=A0AAP0E3T4_9MAGN
MHASLCTIEEITSLGGNWRGNGRTGRRRRGIWGADVDKDDDEDTQRNDHHNATKMINCNMLASSVTSLTLIQSSPSASIACQASLKEPKVLKVQPAYPWYLQHRSLNQEKDS